MLTLYEQLFLLALNEQKGKIPRYISYFFHYGLGGAILGDLVLLGKLNINDKQKVILVDSSPTKNHLLDSAQSKMDASNPPHRIPYWIDVFSHHKKKLQKNIGDQLVEKGILKKVEKRYFGVIRDESYPQLDPSAGYMVKQNLRSVVLAGDPMDESIRVLLSLTLACNLLEHCFTRNEIKTARRRAKEMVNGEPVGQAVFDAINSLTQNAR